MWWSAILRSLQSGGDMSVCAIGHERYISLFMSIYRQLVPGRVTSCVYQSEARRAAEQDWARDSKRLGVIERTDMLDGLFELADLYCSTVGAADYAAFLHELLHAVTISPAGAEAPLLWREKPKPRSLHAPTGGSSSSGMTQSPSRTSFSRSSRRSHSSSSNALHSPSRPSLQSVAKPPPSPASPLKAATKAHWSREEEEFFTSRAVDLG